jgi:diadenylate cyclase
LNWANLHDSIIKALNNVALQFSGWSNRIFSSYQLQNKVLIVLDILIVAFLIYWFVSKLVETKSIRILYGLIFLIILILTGHLLNLATLNWLTGYLTIAFLVALPIIFQPELRLALEKLGRTGLLGYSSSLGMTKKNKVEIIIDVVKNLSNQKTGALILIERKVPLQEYVMSGLLLDAKLSQELLYNLFINNSLLQGGAAVISKDRIIAANCVLPKAAEHFDARLTPSHRSALTITGLTDCLAIDVDPKKGVISYFQQGKIDPKISGTRLAEHISRALKVKY